MGSILHTVDGPRFLDMEIERESWSIGEAFLKGILFEVSSYPKPGLVSAVSTGSHSDMNILTFMASSAAIAPAFYLCAQAGRNHSSDINDLLPLIRSIGIIFEKRLLQATNGINTQRGILFAAGIMCGCAGYLSRNHKYLKSEEICTAASEMTSGIVSRELEALASNTNVELTAGEKLYKKYNARGIRGEVEDGFPSVTGAGLPALKEALERGAKLNDSLVHTLISLVTTVQDTTILWRSGPEDLAWVMEEARRVLQLGSVFTPAGKEALHRMDEEFVKRNISPGGSADLLAVTTGCYLLENGRFPVELM